MGKKTLSWFHIHSWPWKQIVSGLFIFSTLAGLSLPVVAMEIVLAFTGVQAPATSLDGTARTQMIINHLKRLEAGPVAVFIRTQEFTPKTRRRIFLYDNAGHLLVNNGHRYRLLSRPDLYRYQADLLIADRQLRHYKNYFGHVHFADFETDASLSNRSKLKSFARNKMLVPTPVTVQVQDAWLNRRYQQQVNRHRRVDMAAFQNAYVDMIWQQLVHYQSLVLATRGHAPLVLLLEENDLTAYFLPGLIDRIRENGGRILPPRTLFNRPFSASVPVDLHHYHGYFAALADFPAPRLLVPHTAGGDKSWADQFLSHHGLLQ